jgi:hypothetical protein
MMTLTQLSDLATQNNIDIWSGLNLPSESPMDRNTLINTILMQCGLNYPVYADPAVMQSAIAVWSAKNQYTFVHVGKIYEASYSPIENYDRIEDITTKRDRGLTDDTKGDSSKIEKLKSTASENKTSEHSGTDNSSETNEVSAENSSSYQPDNKSVSYINHGEKITDKGSGSTSTDKNTTTGSTQNKTVKELEETSTINRTHGNIGVTTAMQMEKEEMEYLGAYNPYTFLAGLFENELTLFVY